MTEAYTEIGSNYFGQDKPATLINFRPHKLRIIEYSAAICLLNKAIENPRGIEERFLRSARKSGWIIEMYNRDTQKPVKYDAFVTELATKPKAPIKWALKKIALSSPEIDNPIKLKFDLLTSQPTEICVNQSGLEPIKGIDPVSNVYWPQILEIRDN